ncbi:MULTISPECIES: hypothetical protein [Halorussus]|uniref:hypothetical protein n=1 Tax=Halorussus TaxID=1070314 RepID=UPI000E2131E8|nr:MULTISPECIES: hypothetical protein [Halorussus]NHN59823.1 hypothetical protein [Halorussus sp. JP-T4]
MAVSPVHWALSHPALVLTAALGLIAVVWAYDAYEDADDGKEALGGFAENAKSGTGGALNVVLASLVAFVGWAATWFGTAGEFVQFLIGVAPQFPLLSSTIFTIGLGALGLGGVIELKAIHFIGFSALAVLIALAFRTDFGEVSLQ